MIIVRSPLRITLGGGGTDLSSYYTKHGGFCIAATINKYVYITVHPTFVDDLIVKYSQLERVTSAVQLEHPIFREALGLLGIDGRSLELSSMADIPAGTGLGSSSSFTTALLMALYTYKQEMVSPLDLAEQACHIEIDLLKSPIGKQDQYIASYGGINCLEFGLDGQVTVSPLHLPDNVLFDLEDNLMLFFTGYIRSTSEVLKKQIDTPRNIECNLHALKRIALHTYDALEQGDLECFARLLSEQWDYKKLRVLEASNTNIDEWFACGMQNGALGGKLVGAGGGGFLLFYAHDRTRLRRTMTEIGLREVRFRFDFEGTRVVT